MPGVAPDKGEGAQEHVSCQGWHQRKGRGLRSMCHARGGTRRKGRVLRSMCHARGGIRRKGRVLRSMFHARDGTRERGAQEHVCQATSDAGGGGGGSGTSLLLEVAQNGQNVDLRSMFREENRRDESRACFFQGRQKKREDRGARDHL